MRILHWVVYKGRADIVAQILKHPQGKAALKLQNNYGYTPLHLASSCGDVETFKEMLDNCPEALEIKDKDDKTPFQLAVSLGDDKIVEILLAHGNAHH